ncbi:hypothetical protein ES702_00940 [subsurface metagenome]
MKKSFLNWLLIVFGVIIFFVLAQFIDGRIAFLIVCFFVVAVPFIRARRARKAINNLGLTTEEGSLSQEDIRKDDHEAVVQRIATAQERQRKKFKEATGVDAKDIVAEIGREISWADIVNHTFRALELDRSDTTIDQNNQVKAKVHLSHMGICL